jgi:acetylornithine/N-succinyldiaminopimelate aminotransferase
VIEQLLAPGFLDEVLAKGAYLRELLLEICHEFGFNGERGEGLLRALQLNKDIGPDIVERARNLEPIGLLLNSPRPNLLRFMPALNISKEELKQMAEMLKGILREMQ